MRETCNCCGEPFDDGPRWGDGRYGFSCQACYRQNMGADA